MFSVKPLFIEWFQTIKTLLWGQGEDLYLFQLGIPFSLMMLFIAQELNMIMSFKMEYLKNVSVVLYINGPSVCY